MKQYKSLENLDVIFKKLLIEDIQINEDLFNKEYEALTITTPHLRIKSRLAKKTPNKKGYFVAVWKKDINHKNIPLEVEDIYDILVINIIDGENRGQFVFDKEVLIKDGIIHCDSKPGKMAFRVYPDWEYDVNKTAAKTQKWQSEYFIDLSHSLSIEELKQYYKI